MRIATFIAAGLLALAAPQHTLSQAGPAPVFTGMALVYGGPQVNMLSQSLCLPYELLYISVAEYQHSFV